jgi:hypothetical protein
MGNQSHIEYDYQLQWSKQTPHPYCKLNAETLRSPLIKALMGSMNV